MSSPPSASSGADFPRDESEVSGHFNYLLIRTGRLSFSTKLESIDPVVFSEVMRDVDLFTGVASIGADPAWTQNAAAPYREYWRAFSFGDLTEMALNRKDTLQRMIARLPIRDRCHMDGNFLVVRGDRTTYRIHIGSSNVLMEPGSRYLCIVQAAATKASPANLALPFDDDQVLSLILSKAFLLANDRTIKDQSILRQLPAFP